MKQFLLTSILCFFILVTDSFALATLGGHYRCKGEDFLNKTIFDEPTTLTKIGDTYRFTWINKNKVFNGTAILLGNTLSSVWWIEDNKAIGVTTYEILPNGDLKGKWTIQNSSVTGNEYCQKIKL